MGLNAITKISLMVVFPIMICCTIIIVICFNFLGSFLPVWIDDAVVIQAKNQKTFFDYYSYYWGLKLASEYQKVLLGHYLSMDFFQLLKDNQQLIANKNFSPVILNKIALSQGRIRRSVSNTINGEFGDLLFSTWYQKNFTEANQFDSYPTAKTNLFNYPNFEVRFHGSNYFRNEAINITFDVDGFLYSYPATKNPDFGYMVGSRQSCSYVAGLFTFDDRCTDYYNTTKFYNNRLYIAEPFKKIQGDDLRQIICIKDQLDPNQMTMTMNNTYYDALNRLKQAATGYFFMTYPTTLNTIFHPSESKQINLDPIWLKELRETAPNPTLDNFKETFYFGDLSFDDILVVTPLNSTNDGVGLKPDEINLRENVPYKYLNFSDGTNNILRELLVKPILVNTLSDDKKLLVKKNLYTIGLVVDKLQTKESLSGFQDIMKELIYLLTVFLIQIFLAITLYTVRFSSVVFRQMLQPIKDIVGDMQTLDPQNIENFDLLANFEKKSSLEIYNIRSVFQKLIQVMTTAQAAYYSGDDTLALLNFAQAKVFYQELGNQKGVGICESNIGTIHLKNHHYGEAIIAYKAAINVSTNELNELDEDSDSYSSELPQKKLRDINREKVILANRMFNLARACVLESECTQNQRWQSAIDNFQLVKRMDQSLNMNPHRIILISIELSKIYLRLGNLQKAEATLKEAEDNLLQKTFDNLDIPRVILDNKIKIQKALMAKENGSIHHCVEILTNVLEEGEIYDPADRKKCLEELRKIFKKNSIDCTEIDRMLAKFKNQNFEFLFLVDASYSMKDKKIENAIATIKNIFVNFLGEDDKVGYIYFNDIPHIVFHLTYKSMNEVQLDNFIGQIPETKGTYPIINSIYLGLQEFRDNDFDSIPLNKLKREELTPNRWIILITDGGDCKGQDTDELIRNLKPIMEIQKVNLLIVGYTYNEERIAFLRKLCGVTFLSQYIDIGHAEDLSPFLKTLVEETIDDTEEGYKKWKQNTKH